MVSFKQFLTEGGHATAKYNTVRASQKDVDTAIKFVSKTIGIPSIELKNGLLGSTRLTLAGKKKDSGDVDIALPYKEVNADDVHKKMMAATGDQGTYNTGTKVGSYAVPVGGKKVQVDLMYVKDKNWANFIYHSAHGAGSKYPGAVRNIILFTALAHSQKPGEDFVIRDEDGKAIARASKSITLADGMKRMFKYAKPGNKTLIKATPDELRSHLKSIGKSAEFSDKEDATSDPAKVAAHIFGSDVKPSDLLTAEDVIKHVKGLKNADQILRASRSELKKAKLPIPEEL